MYKQECKVKRPVIIISTKNMGACNVQREIRKDVTEGSNVETNVED